MTVTWRRAPAGAHLHCGYCGHSRELAEGEVYAVVRTQTTERPFVRCAACAAARWGLTMPETVAEEVAAPVVPREDPAPSFERVGTVGARARWRFDVKGRAAGDA